MSPPNRRSSQPARPGLASSTFSHDDLGTFDVSVVDSPVTSRSPGPAVALGAARISLEPAFATRGPQLGRDTTSFEGFPSLGQPSRDPGQPGAPRGPGLTAVPEADSEPLHAVPPASELPVSLAVAAEPLESGRIVGTYRLEETLGTGATATVWRAIDLRFKRPIALKLFHARGAASQRVLDRVMGEAQSASSVISDHVVRVRDAGRLPDGGPHFIAMELCAAYSEGGLSVGRTLEEEVPRSLDELVRWGEEIARGVYDAHRVGVFHRDLKPANVLVRPGSRTAQILDFGLATLTRPLADGALDVPTRTISIKVDAAKRQPLCIAGTPAFMAPEQCRGLPWELDPQRDRDLLTRIDVYGIGSILYTLLAGHEPYLEDPEAERSARIVMERVLERPPRPLRRTRGPFTVPPRLVRVVEKAMARDPAERYPDALALAEDLAAFRAGRPTSCDAAHPVLRAGLYARRNKLQMLTALWVLFLVVGGTWMLYASSEMRAAYARMEEARAAEALAWQGTAEAEAARSAAEARAAEALGISEVRTQEAEDARQAEARARHLASKARSAEQSARSTAESALAQAEAARMTADEARAAAASAREEAAEARRAAATSEALAAAARGAATEAETQKEAAQAEAERQREAADAAEARARAARESAQAAEGRAASALERAAEAAREAERAWGAAQAAEGRLSDAQARAREAEGEAQRWKERALRAEAMLSGAGSSGAGGGGQVAPQHPAPQGARGPQGGASNHLGRGPG